MIWKFGTTEYQNAHLIKTQFIEICYISLISYFLFTSVLRYFYIRISSIIGTSLHSDVRVHEDILYLFFNTIRNCNQHTHYDYNSIFISRNPTVRIIIIDDYYEYIDQGQYMGIIMYSLLLKLD